ncbi:pleiotropic ABC efflux transporter of multiple drugs [Coccidioides immitis H538.4]|uniref:Pleiotropic ABC efflux transporter of multiple drugs n=1 Tax=Coccidioides immitis H538.4 TaxID=396776 RepID=A0A0J8U890_COCIT|nr:pleiotropic ABC efflux transporter of multiple drugs [Coccidioides immitis H538.4]
MVIDSGRQVYFGPTKEARAYFEGLGFKEKPRQTTPDYLTGCTDPFEREYKEGRNAENTPSTPDALVQAFEKSRFNEALEQEMDTYRAQLDQEKHVYDDFEMAHLEAKRKFTSKSSVYSIPFYLQVWALMQRQFLIKWQDKFSLAVSWITSIGVAIVLGTVWLKLPTTSAGAFTRGGVLFISLLFNALQAFSELASTMLGRPIVNKHRAYTFHRPSALWIAQIAVDLAFASVQIFVFSVIVYFMCGLVLDAGAFFTFVLIIITGYLSMTLFFRTVGCVCPDFDYALKVPGGTRRLLNNVFGYVEPGKLTALMGASGAAARKNIGVITGDILVDGRTPGSSFQRGTSYAEQLDVHEPTQTVREALRFSATLRQPYEVPEEEKFAYVEEIISLLELENLADAIIGDPETGLSVEERKRVTIGVELAAKPQLLLFLDEPTSGLDSQSAFNIVRFLRKLAAAGQAILCTIHQPNSALFENFDRLLLLQRGGECVYFGDIGTDARILRDYFHRNGADCPSNANPAEWMLDAIGAGQTPRIGSRDWGDVWETSPEFEQVKQRIVEIKDERVKATEGASASADAEKEYATPLWHQIKVVCRRTNLAFWRSPNYGFTRLFSHVALALITGLCYLQLNDSRSSLQYRIFVLFQITVIPALILAQVEPKPQIPKFWRVWLYELDPFTRLMSGMIVTELHDRPVTCKPEELNRFVPPPGQDCFSYMKEFFANGGPGYLVKNATDICEYCAYKVGDQFYKPFGMEFSNRWRDLGIFLCFIASNLILLFVGSRYLNFNRR